MPAPMMASYPDYSAFPEPRGATNPVLLRRSRRSHRYHHHQHRRRRSPTLSTESSWSEAETESSAVSLTNFPRYRLRRRSSRRHNRDPERGYVEPYDIDLEAHPDDQPSPPLQGKFNFVGSTGPLFSLYSNLAKNVDEKTTDHWKHEATDGILIFTGLFSAAVAALLTVSIQDLRVKPESQDTSAFYLANIYQVLADPNVTPPRPSVLSTVATPPPFSPPTYVVWVNSLWFLSLLISLTCALLAMLLRQWAHRYIRLTQPLQCRPEKRARMRAFYADGVDKMRVPRVVETLSALIHLYLFLFFAGLGIFLFNINHIVFICAISWIGLFTVVYGWMTVMPIFWHHSPYYAPLSSTAWFLHASMLHAFFTVTAFIAHRFVSRHTRRRFRFLSWHYGRRMSGGVSKAAEEAALEQSSKIDVGILDWTASILGEDDTQEKFFEAIPGFVNSQNVEHLERPFPDELRLKIIDSLAEFLERNLSSNSVSRKIKNRRLVICMNATKEVGRADDIYKILSLLTNDTLGEDDTREKFFEAIPSFFNSQMVKNLKRALPNMIRSELVGSLEEFLASNLSSNSVSEEIKIHRVIICMNATKEIGESTDIYRMLSHLTNGPLGGDDKLQEKLFEIIPDFFELMPEGEGVSKEDICGLLYPELQDALDGFLFRTLPSDAVIESVKNHRLGIYFNAIKVIYNPEQVFDALSDILDGKFGQLPQSIETANILARQGSYYTDDEGIAQIARCLAANVLLTIHPRDDRWIALVTDQFGLPKHELRDHIAHDDDSVLLAILIHVARQVIRTDSWDWSGWILSSLSKFDIHNTLPGLQNEFCALWNEIVLRARDEVLPYVNFLHHIRRLYIDLHEGTNAASTAFDASTRDLDPILDLPSSYPLCNIATHNPSSTVPPPNQLDHPDRSESQPIPSRSTTPQQVEEANIEPGHPSSPDYNPPAQESPSPSLTTDLVDIPPHVISATVPSVHESSQTVSLDSNRVDSTEVFHPLPESSSSTANLTTNIMQNESTPDIPITVTSFTVPHPPSVSVERDRNEQQDVTAPHAGSDITRISSTANQISQYTRNTAPAVHSHISPQIPSISDVDVTTSIGSLSSPEDQETVHPSPLAPMEASPHVQQSGPSTPDVRSASALATERNESP